MVLCQSWIIGGGGNALPCLRPCHLLTRIESEIKIFTLTVYYYSSEHGQTYDQYKAVIETKQGRLIIYPTVANLSQHVCQEL